MSCMIVADLVRVALVIIFVADGAIFHIRWRSTEVDTLALRISRLKITHSCNQSAAETLDFITIC